MHETKLLEMCKTPLVGETKKERSGWLQIYSGQPFANSTYLALIGTDRVAVLNSHGTTIWVHRLGAFKKWNKKFEPYVKFLMQRRTHLFERVHTLSTYRRTMEAAIQKSQHRKVPGALPVGYNLYDIIRDYLIG